jgi:hypothetical protein
LKKVKSRLSRKTALYTPASTTTILVNYSRELKILEIEYEGNRVYHYKDVEPMRWEQLKSVIGSGGSAGRFINFFVKPFYEAELIRNT